MTERLWDVPSSWCWVSIAGIGEVVSGGTPSTKDASYWGDEITWFSPADLTGYRAKHIRRGAKSLSRKGLANSSARVLPAGSVMFSSRAPIGYVAINAVEAATNQGFKSVIPSPVIFNEYLYYYLKASKQLAEERATGTTFKEISGSAFSVLPVALPPLPEQHRIVAKIDALFSELDAGQDSLTRAQAQLRLYRQSLLKAAFQGRLTADWRAANPDKLESPETLLSHIRSERDARYKQALDDWHQALAEWRAGGEVERKPAKPKQPAALSERETETHHESGWPSFSLGDLMSVSSGIGLTAASMIDGPHRVYGGNGVAGMHNDWMLEEPTLILGRVGAKCGVAHITEPWSWVTDNALIVTPLVCSFDLKFFRYLLEYMDLNKLGSSTGQPVISGSKIYGQTVNLPNAAEQSEIADRLDKGLSAVDHFATEITTALAKITALRQSILKQAFSGRLVPQDPADEPASALLARLRDTAQVPRTRRKTPA